MLRQLWPLDRAQLEIARIILLTTARTGQDRSSDIIGSVAVAL